MTGDGTVPGAGGPRSSDEGLAAAEIHDVLRNDRRRLVLERLRSDDGTGTVSVVPLTVAFTCTVTVSFGFGSVFVPFSSVS